MDILAHCRAMAAFCRQHAQFDNESSTFWIAEADEWDGLIADYSNNPMDANAVAAANHRLRISHTDVETARTQND